MSKSELNELPFCTCFNLRKASRAVTKYFDERLRPAGLRATQFPVLAVTQIRKNPTYLELSETLVMDPTTVSRTVKDLESKGFLKTEAGADRRERKVSLTTKGAKALKAAFPLWKKAQSNFVELLGETNFKTTLKTINKLVEYSKA